MYVVVVVIDIPVGFCSDELNPVGFEDHKYEDISPEPLVDKLIVFPEQTFEADVPTVTDGELLTCIDVVLVAIREVASVTVT